MLLSHPDKNLETYKKAKNQKAFLLFY